MKNNMTIRNTTNRKSIRLKDYDYSQPGTYFVTICTNNMKKIFGQIDDGVMKLNHLGEIARRELLQVPKTYPGVELFDDEYVIMPNHIHAILWKFDVGATPVLSSWCTAPACRRRVARISSSGPNPKTLGAIVGQYKSRVTKQINRLRETPGKPVWQRNYYDRIIRNDKELQAIRKYIADNPLQWEDDHGKGVHDFI